MIRGTLRGVRLVIASVLLCVLLPGVADAEDFASLDRPGPALSVQQAQLDASLHCQDSVRDAKVEPVLLNPATGVTVEQNFSWNYEKALTQLGIPYCTYDAPSHTLEDIQVSGEYLVHAIRAVHALAGRKIAVMGHSQGGMSMRWALRFWPDTRTMVDDVIGFSGSNHGTTVSGGDCAQDGCPPAVWQQGAKARFIAALNSRAETFPGISYTEVFTHTDEVVQPNSGDAASAALHGGGGRVTNVAAQDVCPADVMEHLMIGTIDPTAYALAVDALTHDGPANPGRVGAASCTQALMPGVDPLSLDNELQVLAGAPGLLAVMTPVNVVGVRSLKQEPELACYTLEAGCPAPASATLTACASARRFTIRLPRGLRAARVTVAGKRVATKRAGGRLTAVVDLRGRAKASTRVVVRGRRGGRAVRQVRTYHPCVRRA